MLKRFVTGAVRSAPSAPVDVTRTVYNGLCKAFMRELVVDLMSGASAGGINGAMLGCATTYDRRLHPDFVRNKWLVLGDLSLLLERSSKSDPRSLMRGGYFRKHLLLTFQALCGDPNADAADLASTARPEEQPRDAGAAKSEAPLLDVTTTDLAGTERLYADAWGGSWWRANTARGSSSAAGGLHRGEPCDGGSIVGVVSVRVRAVARQGRSCYGARRIRQPALRDRRWLLDNAPIKPCSI